MNPVSDSLEWRDVSLWRGDRLLQKGLTGELRPGRALTLRGPNGCGKTTFIRTLCGLSDPETGVVIWGDEPVQRIRSEYYRALAYSGHALGLKGDLSPRENLAFARSMRGLSGDAHELITALGLERCVDLPVKQLSAGQKQRAALAAVLGSGAAIWVLDEPYTHLDAGGRDWLAGRFNAHLAEGGRLLLAAHQDTGLDTAAESVLELEGAVA
jgi:heme exporter protein A